MAEPGAAPLSRLTPPAPLTGEPFQAAGSLYKASPARGCGVERRLRRRKRDGAGLTVAEHKRASARAVRCGHRKPDGGCAARRRRRGGIAALCRRYPRPPGPCPVLRRGRAAAGTACAIATSLPASPFRPAGAGRSPIGRPGELLRSEKRRTTRHKLHGTVNAAILGRPWFRPCHAIKHRLFGDEKQRNALRSSLRSLPALRLAAQTRDMIARCRQTRNSP